MNSRDAHVRLLFRLAQQLPTKRLHVPMSPTTTGEAMRTKAFNTPCNFSEVALIEAMGDVGPAFTYELHVATADLPMAIHLCRKMMAQYQYNPLAPYINVKGNALYKRGEWSIGANGKAMWSAGVGTL